MIAVIFGDDAGRIGARQTGRIMARRHHRNERTGRPKAVCRECYDDTHSDIR